MNTLVSILILLVIFVLTCGIKAKFRYQSEKRENLVYQIDNINSDSCTADKLINVWFAGQSVGCGKEYDLALFSDGKAPKLSLDRANINDLYTLLMIDPDAPTREFPSEKYWLHWMITDIKNSDIRTGKIVAPYTPPTPPLGSGPHRYIILLLKQPAEIKKTLVVDSRGKFNLFGFAQKFGITQLNGLKYFITEHK